MLNIIKETQGDTLVVKLVGSLDERSKIDELIGAPPKKLKVNCKELVRINSHGVRLWVKYFHELSTKGIKVKFIECSPVIVQQMNIISNFLEGEIESVCAPFFCSSCKNQFISVFQTEELKRLAFKIPSQKCPKCGVGMAVFDDIESEYFGFLQRKKS